MGQPLKLEVFETVDVPESPVFLLPEDVEEIRLNAYERGYVAGWDDCGHQTQEDDNSRRAAIARQVEQLNFTYHEARGHVLQALEPLFEALLGAVLPVAARASIVPLAVEQLLPLAHAAAEAPITLRIASGSRAAYEAAFDGLVLPPLEVVEVDDLQEGQVEFSFGTSESRLDLNHTAETIQRAVERFYQIQTEESRRA
ncbi:flagellar biosynthesis protein [Pararhodobacter oceanensis]|uniref:Flagellar biosynthesis protein n=1 Tax=Pararhodobacter oceanensis TaxID=2172121 RepID=A0A2T8HYV2_9RHOB|nr:flagellar biosynthesis protein [Pararhodobacter oceanensis]PVH30579.1 flagellar biosynthesis protein [Pararhodobacter oceanensis]